MRGTVKKSLFVCLAIGLAAFALQSHRLATSPTPLYVIEDDIVIEASIDRVWAVLSDFESYPDWNPYATRILGPAVVGERIELTIEQEDWAEPLVLHPTINRWEPGRALGWHGRVLFPGLHETDHFFELTALGASQTRLHHAEAFRGWLPELAQPLEARAFTRRAFRAMNEALKRRVEQVAGAVPDRLP